MFRPAAASDRVQAVLLFQLSEMNMFYVKISFQPAAHHRTHL